LSTDHFYPSKNASQNISGDAGGDDWHNALAVNRAMMVIHIDILIFIVFSCKLGTSVSFRGRVVGKQGT
jgi:hypothetical protein